MAKKYIDDLANSIKTSINKQFKDRTVARFLSEVEEVDDWISTGAIGLDIGVSNRKNGGWPRGKIVELSGMESSGKSLLAAHAIKSTQEAGGLGIFIDTESAYHTPFLLAIGVDIDNMVYLDNLITLEDIYQAVEIILLGVIEAKDNQPVTIILDSQAGATSEMELESDYGKDGWATGKAIVNSKAMRKLTTLVKKANALFIITNQLRDKLGATFGDTYCVDPDTTKIQIRYKADYASYIRGFKSKKYVEEEILVKDFSDRFANNDDFLNPEEFDIIPELNCEILSYDLKNRKDVYKPIKTFIVKNQVAEYYTDGKLKCTASHKIWDDRTREWIKANNHPDFTIVKKAMKVADFSIKDTQNYYANGRLNHNTTSGGHAIGFHSSVRVRLKKLGQIKGDVNDVKETIGIHTEAHIFKNRVGPNHRKVTFNVYYDVGINDFENWVDILKKHKMVENAKGSPWYTWTDLEQDDDGGIPKKHKFMKKQFENLITVKEPHLYSQIYNAIADAMIMQYKTSELSEAQISVELDDEKGEKKSTTKKTKPPKKLDIDELMNKNPDLQDEDKKTKP